MLAIKRSHQETVIDKLEQEKLDLNLKFETNGSIIPSGNCNGNASTATAAQGSTFYTASSASEGQIGALYSGYNSCYLYNNST